MTAHLRILFVDDEPHVLRGLQRSMHEMMDTWEMTFCENGADALRFMETHSVDVVVSDMRMPQMDGACLLDTIRHRYPRTIRVILSGYAESESVLKTVEPAHIYLAKPCHPDSLRDAIARPLALRRFLADADLLAVVGGLSNLPSLPGFYVELMGELRRPDASAASVARILSHDLAMTAEILKLTNSAFFALNSHVTTVFQAVKTLGMETIQTLVLHVGIFRQLDSVRTSPGLLESLTEFSLRRGALAEAIALDDGCPAATAKACHCAAMLSSIGALVLLDQDAERYCKTLALMGDGLTLFQAERQVYNTCTSYLGAYLLGLWGFSDGIVEAVAFAGCPRSAPKPDNPILLINHVAQALGPRFPLLPDQIVEPEKLDMTYLIDMRKDGRVRRWRDLAQQQ